MFIEKFEGSMTRIVFISTITYFTLALYMTAIGVNDPYLSAIVPTIGFNLSTWSLPWLKVLWLKLIGETNISSKNVNSSTALEC